MSSLSKTQSPRVNPFDRVLGPMAHDSSDSAGQFTDKGLECDCGRLDCDSSSSGEERRDKDPECNCGCLTKENVAGLRHVANTYDTYKCLDCKVILSGYRLGGKNLDAHIFHSAVSDKRCRYILDTFKGREGQLRALEGLMRFQRGYVAFPGQLLVAKKQHRDIEGQLYCVVCGQKKGTPHHVGCVDLMAHVEEYVRHTTIVDQPHRYPLFNDDMNRAPGRLECDSTATTSDVTDFSVLGDPGSMKLVPGTLDKHNCALCGLNLHAFVQGDTLLGEHIYHKYQNKETCPYIETMYSPEQIVYRLGIERFRRGMVAFPTLLFEAEDGYAYVGATKRCVVCATAMRAASAASVASMKYRPKNWPVYVHKGGCGAMTNSVNAKIKHRHMLG